MADCFLMKSGSTVDTETIPDIYNHGNIVGLNPAIFNVNTNILSVYDYFCYTYSSRYGLPTINDNYVYFPASDNKTFIIPFNINAKGYKYLCVDAEIKNGKQDTWNVSSFGVVDSFSTGGNYQEFKYKVFKRFTDSYINKPYVYDFPRQIVKFDISDLNEICIGGHNCDCELYIYSIYLSNNEDEGI